MNFCNHDIPLTEQCIKCDIENSDENKMTNKTMTLDDADKYTDMTFVQLLLILVNRDKELETLKASLNEAVEVISENCIDDCGFSIDESTPSQLRSILREIDLKAREFLEKIK